MLNPRLGDIKNRLNNWLHPTSAVVEGTVQNTSHPVPNVIARANARFDDKTGDGGDFSSGHSRRNPLSRDLNRKNNLLYCDKFIVPAGVDYHKLEDVISLDATPKPQALDERSCTQTLSLNSHPYNVDCIFASQNNTAFDICLY
jgi:hypothetical protein